MGLCSELPCVKELRNRVMKVLQQEVLVVTFCSKFCSMWVKSREVLPKMWGFFFKDILWRKTGVHESRVYKHLGYCFLVLGFLHDVRSKFADDVSGLSDDFIFTGHMTRHASLLTFRDSLWVPYYWSYNQRSEFADDVSGLSSFLVIETTKRVFWRRFRTPCGSHLHLSYD
jgi:hypothetical protein